MKRPQRLTSTQTRLSSTVKKALGYHLLTEKLSPSANTSTVCTSSNTEFLCLESPGSKRMRMVRTWRTSGTTFSNMELAVAEKLGQIKRKRACKRCLASARRETMSAKRPSLSSMTTMISTGTPSRLPSRSSRGTFRMTSRSWRMACSLQFAGRPRLTQLKSLQRLQSGSFLISLRENLHSMRLEIDARWYRLGMVALCARPTKKSRRKCGFTARCRAMIRVATKSSSLPALAPAVKTG